MIVYVVMVICRVLQKSLFHQLLFYQ